MASFPRCEVRYRGDPVADRLVTLERIFVERLRQPVRVGASGSSIETSWIRSSAPRPIGCPAWASSVESPPSTATRCFWSARSTNAGRTSTGTFQADGSKKARLQRQAAARELLEEAGVRVPLYDLELVSSIEIIREGHKISQSWNFTVTVTDPRLCPADPDGLVREARWFPRSQAVDHLAALPYPPIREAAMIFLRDGTRGLHWTFELPAGSDAFSDFTWQVPSAKRA